VVAHPANPRTVVGDVTELAESISAQGILQAPTVLPATRVAAAWPHHAEAIEASNAEWVLLMGHRRTAAARKAGLAEIDVVVREDGLADDAAAQLDAMVAENVAREPLSPVEEARAFAASRAAGRTQAQIAAAAGCTQGHVSKQLSLLKLPESVLAEVEAGGLDVSAVLPLTRVAPEVAERASQLMRRHAGTWQGESQQAIAAATRVIETETATARSRATAAAEGLRLVDDPHKEFGDQVWSRRLRGEDDVAAARVDGTLVAAVNGYGDLDYFTTGQVETMTPWEAAETARKASAKDRKDAATAREAVILTLVAAVSRLAETTAAGMVDAVIGSASADTGRLAGRWLRELGVEVDVTNWAERRTVLTTQPWATRLHIAHALSIAGREAPLRATYHAWDVVDVAWIDHLVAAGHQLCDYEAEQVEAVEEAARRVAEALVDERQDDAEEGLAWDESEEAWVLVTGDGDRIPCDTGAAEDDADAAAAWATAWLAEHDGEAPVTWWPDLSGVHRPQWDPETVPGTTAVTT